MSYQATIRAIEAAERRRQREAQRRFLELQRQAKEQAKLSALEKARLEVETYENRLELLLSVHKEQGEISDWNAILAAPPPTAPKRANQREDGAFNRLNSYSPNIFEMALGKADRESARLAADVDVARQREEADFQRVQGTYRQTATSFRRIAFSMTCQ